MRIGMLGPLEVFGDDDGAVLVAGSRLRALLIALAVDPGRVVPTSRLVDAVWQDDPPGGASNALQALVSRLRRVLGGPVVEAHPSGYRLAVDPDDVDAVQFERLVAAGRARAGEDPAAAAATLREALGLWRGSALVDVADDEYFAGAVARLDALRLTATEERITAELRLGRGPELVDELTVLVAEHPLRERLVAALMRALSEAGRPAEALDAYEHTRALLADRLGTDPSAELSAIHTAVLRGELGPEPAAGPLMNARPSALRGDTAAGGRRHEATHKPARGRDQLHWSHRRRGQGRRARRRLPAHHARRPWRVG